MTNAGDGSGRLFVVEQTGRIRIIDGGTVARDAVPRPARLDHDRRRAAACSGSRSTRASRPQPYIYVNFTDRNGDTAINRYTVSSNPNVVNRASGVRILTIAQPYANHNGGNLAFGPDGYLYIGMGDGGSAGDPGNRAQNINTLLGKMLRIDVDHDVGRAHYRSPAINPYVGKTGLDEIWSRGLRNPWRWSFDRADRPALDRRRRPEPLRGGRPVEPGRRRRRPGAAPTTAGACMEGRACYKPVDAAARRRQAAAAGGLRAMPSAAPTTARSPAASSTAGRPIRCWPAAMSSATSARAGSG